MTNDAEQRKQVWYDALTTFLSLPKEYHAHKITGYFASASRAQLEALGFVRCSCSCWRHE